MDSKFMIDKDDFQMPPLPECPLPEHPMNKLDDIRTFIDYAGKQTQATESLVKETVRPWKLSLLVAIIFFVAYISVDKCVDAYERLQYDYSSDETTATGVYAQITGNNGINSASELSSQDIQTAIEMLQEQLELAKAREEG